MKKKLSIRFPTGTPIMIELHNGDCLSVMRGMADNSVDLVLTDPPYGIGEAAGKNKSRSAIRNGRYIRATDFGNHAWDNQIPSKECFDEMIRVSKNQIIFGGNYFVGYLTNSPCWIVWDKDNSGDFADCEIAWTSFKTAIRKVKWRWNGMLQEDMKRKERRVHPTQKPVGVMSWILNKYSNESDTILDPFMGSGTTGVSCVALNRSFIGIEISTEYFNLAKTRIHRKQDDFSLLKNL